MIKRLVHAWQVVVGIARRFFTEDPLITRLAMASLVMILFLLGWVLAHRRGGYIPPPERTVVVEEVPTILGPTPVVMDAPRARQGTLLVDNAHDNNYGPEELNSLLSEAVAHGYGFEYWEVDDELPTLLRYTDSLAIVAPRETFSPQELRQLRDFVDKGGRLLLIADPTRNSDVDGVNSVAAPFGIIFEEDYVYNVVENQGNYRHVIVRDFLPSAVTHGLREVVFYTAHSLASPAEGIILADENTFSSLRETPGGLTVAALTEDGKVLALPDLTFMAEPYNAVRDNDRLVSNLAGFLTGGQRSYYLTDFPHFFNRSIDVVFANPSLFSNLLEQGIELKEQLWQAGKEAEFRPEATDAHDLLFIGLFQDMEPVEDYLVLGGISIVEKGERGMATSTPSPTEDEAAVGTTLVPSATRTDESTGAHIAIEGLGQLEQEGASLFYLHKSSDGLALILLAQTEETLEEALDILLEERLADCQISPDTAVCRFERLGPRTTPTSRATATATMTASPTPEE